MSDQRAVKVGAECPHGDPSCPCPDGDPCHYEGDDPMACPNLPAYDEHGEHCHVEGGRQAAHERFSKEPRG